MDPTELPLRDIHLPDAISWWPPAPGWWLLAFALIAVSVFLLLRWRRHRALQGSAAYLVHVELQRVKKAWQDHNNNEYLVQDISSWLRRAAMSLRNREQAASLTGERWWQFLDELAGSKVFSGDGGRLLSQAPYREDANIDDTELLRLCDTWVDHLMRQQAGDRA